MGRMHPKDVASAIGAKFAERDIPFTFSKYRHWQRGVVKMKGSKSVLRLVTSMREEGTDGDGNGELEDAHAVTSASLTQAGHSIKTAFVAYAQSSAPGDISLSAQSSRIEIFRMASQEWHVDMGLRNLDPTRLSRPGQGAAAGSLGGGKSRAGSVAGTPDGRGAESGDGGQAECEGADEGDGNTPSTRRSVGRIVGNGRWDADASPMGAPDLEDMVRRKVADAMRDMFHPYAKNGNGALRRVLRDEASSWPAVPGPDAVDNDAVP